MAAIGENSVMARASKFIGEYQLVPGIVQQVDVHVWQSFHQVAMRMFRATGKHHQETTQV